jgi:uncharacterized membrane protein
VPLPSRSRLPAILLGVGLGGFLDGILLHQILHWHNMGSAILPPDTLDALRRNMTWDGYFHAAVWLCTVIGVYLLLALARSGAPLPHPTAFTGLMLMGWGAFNLVEGTVDHHLLDLHHVRDLPAHVPALDLLFLGVGGVLLLVVGWWLSNARLEPAPPGGPAPHP